MKQRAIDRIKRQLKFLVENRKTIIADTDTHLTDFSIMSAQMQKKYESTYNLYQGRPISVEDLLTEMKMAGVDLCLCWQNPATTWYRGGSLNFEYLLRSNRYIFECSCRYPEKIIPSGWTDPKALGMETAKEMVRICVEDFGCPVVKINPAQNAFQIDSDQVIELTRTIIDYGVVPAFHFAADTKYTPTEGLCHLADLFPDSKILAVHMGGGGASYMEAEKMYNDIRSLGLKYKNLYFVESAKRDIHIESDFITYTLSGEADYKRIFCASDAPYGRMTWNYGGYRSMFASLIDSEHHTDSRVRNHAALFDKALAQRFMGGNFADFMIEQYTGMLHREVSPTHEYELLK